jgi:hypothetical protein
MYQELADPRFMPMWAMSRPSAEETESQAPPTARTRSEEELAAWTQHAMSANGFADAA